MANKFRLIKMLGHLFPKLKLLFALFLSYGCFYLVLYVSNSSNLLKRVNATYKLLDYRISPRRTAQHEKLYPPRNNMEKCRSMYGSIGVLVVVESENDKQNYKVAQESLKCYLRSTSYTYLYINAETDERTKGKCNQRDFTFKRICIAAHYLQDFDWLLPVDADIGVVNPNHCIEEYIDPRVDMIFFERFFNWEIQAASYLLNQSRKFLMDWADMDKERLHGYSNRDNGALHIHILRTVIPSAVAEIKTCDKLWRNVADFNKYYNYVICVKYHLGAVRLFPGVLRILRRGHSWVRDEFITDNIERSWSDQDFMIHGWKSNDFAATQVFAKMPNSEECGRNLDGWNWIPEKHVTVEKMQKALKEKEASYATTFPRQDPYLPFLIGPEVGECYPNCDQYT